MRRYRYFDNNVFVVCVCNNGFFFVVCVLYFGVFFFFVVWFVTKVFHRGPYVPRVALEPKGAHTSISKETFSYF